MSCLERQRLPRIFHEAMNENVAEKVKSKPLAVPNAQSLKPLIEFQIQVGRWTITGPRGGVPAFQNLPVFSLCSDEMGR